MYIVYDQIPPDRINIRLVLVHPDTNSIHPYLTSIISYKKLNCYDSSLTTTV